MRTIITHFYNEEFLLPWWLRHHRTMFDHGVLIDHGSTDSSIDIIREIVPNWRIVRSRLTAFDAFLTDFEVMQYENELPKSWKIVLNVTEFLLPCHDLDTIERHLLRHNMVGISTTGFVVVDKDPNSEPELSKSLPLQKTWGFDDNSIVLPGERVKHGLTEIICRNRFYHCGEVGMYHPGRHGSWHPDSKLRANYLLTAHFGYAPWTSAFKRRKLQISSRVPTSDLTRGWGTLHSRNASSLEEDFVRVGSLAGDLTKNIHYSEAIQRIQDSIF